MIKIILPVLSLLLCCLPLFTQIPTFDSFDRQIEYVTSKNDANQPCITLQQYEIIEEQCNKNAKLFGLQPSLAPGTVSLAWPLQAAPGLKDCSYYRISAYVDQDKASDTFKDFNCGTNTYDGHGGTDISISPFNFYKMDNDFVQVIAAAPGMIVDKHDGEFDKNCASTTIMANYIVIQHNDGSRILYFHMKKNSLIKKDIGQSVVIGEYLGNVGSSGNSSGPHLHFEVWSGSTNATRVDPFSGTCNTLNANSWWTAQKAYKETQIVKASVNTTDIVLLPCPQTDILNESSQYTIPFQGQGLAPGYAKFYIIIREELKGLTADMSILNPDGSTFTSWTYSSASDSQTRISGYSKKLPTLPGKYIFKASYNGLSCSFNFEMIGATSNDNQESNSTFKIYPNPSNGKFILKSGNENAKLIEVYNMLGKKIFQSQFSAQKLEVNLNVASGIYFYQLRDNVKVIASGKLLVE